MNYLDIARRTLESLKVEAEAPVLTPSDAWQANAERTKEGEADVMAVQWVDEPDAYHGDESTEVIYPPDPCPKCGFMELWETMASNWRCLRCDPPTEARRLRERAARLRG